MQTAARSQGSIAPSCNAACIAAIPCALMPPRLVAVLLGLSGDGASGCMPTCSYTSHACACLLPPAACCSIVFIILMAAPAFLGKAIGAPTVLVAGGKRAMMQGKAALVQRTEALANQSWATAAKESWASAADAFGGSSHAGKDAAVVYHAPGVAKSAAMEAAAGAKKAAAEAAHAAMEVEEQAAGFAGEAVDAGEAALAGLQHSVVEEGAPARRNDMEGGGTPKGLQAVQTHASEGARTAFVVWAFLAGGLYIASLALLVIGTVSYHLAWQPQLRRLCHAVWELTRDNHHLNRCLSSPATDGAAAICAQFGGGVLPGKLWPACLPAPATASPASLHAEAWPPLALACAAGPQRQRWSAGRHAVADVSEEA